MKPNAVNPCQNDGVCSLTSDLTAECSCLAGFTGQFCEITPCTSNPCQNNGLCEIKGDSYQCICPAGYHGHDCWFTPCSAKKCQNESTCLIDNGEAKCICEDGFHGDRCELDKCSQNPCNDRGKCSIGSEISNSENEHGFSCECDEGFSGDFCEITPCSGMTCSNRGECEVHGQQGYCNCMAGWFGTYCNENACSSNPCLNEGACNVKPFQFNHKDPIPKFFEISSGVFLETIQNLNAEWTITFGLKLTKKSDVWGVVFHMTRELDGEPKDLLTVWQEKGMSKFYKFYLINIYMSLQIRQRFGFATSKIANRMLKNCILK